MWYPMAFRMLDARLVVLIVWLAALVLAVAVIGPDTLLREARELTPDKIRQFVLSYGVFSFLVYELLHVIRPFTFLPVTPFTIASGFIFGPVYGLLFSMLGTTSAAIIMFFLSRYVFRDYVKKSLSTRYAGFDSRFDTGGVFTVASLRIIPVIPYDAVGYVSGVSSIHFSDYIIGTLIGEFPGAFVLTMLGYNMTNLNSPWFIVSLVLAVLLFLVPEIYRRLPKKDK